MLVHLSSQDTSQTRIGPGLWRKQLLRLSEWVHPNDPKRKLRVTPELIARLKANFDARILDFVPVPSRHTDDWEANKGEVLALEADPAKGLYAIVKVDAETDQAIEAKQVRGVSAGFEEDYLDKSTGQRIGPLLRHVALTNVPYIRGLEGFERAVNLSAGDLPIVALSEVTELDSRRGISATLPRDANPSSSEASVTVEEAKALLKKDANIDVDALSETAAAFSKHQKDIETAGRVRDVLRGAGIVALSEDAAPADVAAAVTALSEENASLKKAAKTEKATRMVAPYLKAGKLDKAAGPQMIELAETNPDLAASILKGLSGNVLLSEIGSTDDGDDDLLAPPVTLSEDAAAAKAAEILERQRKTGAARAAA